VGDLICAFSLLRVHQFEGALVFALQAYRPWPTAQP